MLKHVANFIISIQRIYVLLNEVPSLIFVHFIVCIFFLFFLIPHVLFFKMFVVYRLQQKTEMYMPVGHISF
jgi:hypothetical protein